MLDKMFELKTEPLPSMGKLLLHVAIMQGGNAVFTKVIDANDLEQINQMNDKAALALNVSIDKVEKDLFDHVLNAREWWKAKQASDQVNEGFQAKFVTSEALEKMDAKHRWLIKHVLVRDQPGLMGGPKKAMKTSILIDAAISLGTGKPFLGKFEIPERLPVAVLSGESGQITIRETAMRVAQCKGVKLTDCEVLWGFELPRLGVDRDLAALATGLRDNNVGVVFIDPAYLCLLAGSPDVQANNMFQVGPLLMKAAKVCQDVGATLILVHHTTKPAGGLRMQTGEPLELEDLAYSGFQEFARQWLLVNRRQKYEPGSGKHLLWLNIGGSAGHSGCWGVDIEEGKLSDNFGGRRWLVRVQSMEEALKGMSEAKEVKKESSKQAKMIEDMAKVVKVLETIPEGETQTEIAKLSGVRPNDVGPLMTALLDQKKVVRVQISKRSGQGEKMYNAWRLANPTEIIVGKLDEMDLLRPEVIALPVRKRRKRMDNKLANEDDRDAFDDMEAANESAT